MRKRSSMVAVASVVVAALCLPAQASEVTTVGSTVFDGTVTLPSVPCVPVEPEDCRGSLAAQWAGEAAGRVGTRPFHLTWKTEPGAFTAAFQYTERGCDGVGGIASGRGTATAGPGTMLGEWRHGGNDTFPRAILDLEAAFSFQWARTGDRVTLHLDPFVLSFEVSGVGRVEVVHGALDITALMPPAGCGSSVASSIAGATAITQT